MTRLFACSLLQANQEGSCKVMTKILGHWPCKMTCCSVVRLEETSGVGIWIPGACEVRDTLCSTYWASFDHRRLERSMTGHTKTVRCLGFVDSGTAISASSDTTLKIWDLGSGACKPHFPVIRPLSELWCLQKNLQFLGMGTAHASFGVSLSIADLQL